MSDPVDPVYDTRSHIRNFAIIAHIDHGKSTLVPPRALLRVRGLQPRAREERPYGTALVFQ